MTTTYAFGATGPKAALAPFNYQVRDLREFDVQLDVLYCGVCHSDLHQARDEWRNTIYPVVPGHEIVGRVTAVGSQATRFKIGDIVGVGCMVDSCRACPSCKEGLEQYCEGETGFVPTYNGIDKQTGATTYGGYSSQMVVDEAYVLSIPRNLDLAGVAPLLCAGITTYSPLRTWGAGPGKKVGIVGLGGLGHMGVKLAAAMGAHVVLFTTSPSKIEDGKRLGASEVVISRNPDEMNAHANSFDLILNTVAAQHDLNPFLNLLRRDGTMVLVGVPEHDHPSPQVFNLIFKRRRLAGSLIGGIAETQEMLDFCGEHGITSDIELIPVQQINEAYERMLKSDVKYRFVIDSASLKQQ
ncbi:hydroxyacid dehydrogenase [Bordetella genomosp. 10]|uniref:Hydroxyacid dehydrogenase n=1 Tax=Bordetella genomosp. 10 TaxID=1416804 RepID=A0A261SKZ0_9BORD|nr:NAD(P)-dependent alcohol dehydrogenase [Bordetella genomosp. 10]OZI38066.1 hydroxyacid dehydrogenase [Bordetella genomosp. 10]